MNFEFAERTKKVHQAMGMLMNIRNNNFSMHTII